MQAAGVAAAGTRVMWSAGAGAGMFVLFSNGDGVKAYSGELARMTLHFLSRPGYAQYPALGGGGEGMAGGNNGGGNSVAALAPLTERLDQLAMEMARMRQGQTLSAMVGGPPSITTTVVVIGTTGVVLYVCGIRSLDDVMYVTKKHFNTTVETLKEGVTGLAAALGRVRSELLEKVGVVETKVDEARAALEIKIDGVHDEVKGVAKSQDLMEGMIRGIEGQLELTQEQIKQANKGIVILCSVIAESGVSNEDLLEFTRKHGGIPPAQRANSAAASSASTKPGATVTYSQPAAKAEFLHDVLLREGLQHLISFSSSSKESKASENVPTATPLPMDFASVLAGISAIAPVSAKTTAA